MNDDVGHHQSISVFVAVICAQLRKVHSLRCISCPVIFYVDRVCGKLLLNMLGQLAWDRWLLHDRDADGRPKRIRISSAALAGLIIERVQSKYPRSARQKKVEGEVTVSAVIGANGRVQDVTVISGPPELHEAAVDAMKKWRFKPFQLDRHAVEVQSNFMFNYAIGN